MEQRTNQLLQTRYQYQIIKRISPYCPMEISRALFISRVMGYSPDTNDYHSFLLYAVKTGIHSYFKSIQIVTNTNLEKIYTLPGGYDNFFIYREGDGIGALAFSNSYPTTA